jgi:hypothetical protein
VDQQQNQMKSQIGGLKESIRKLTHSLEKSVAPSEREMSPWAISKYFGDLVPNTSA